MLSPRLERLRERLLAAKPEVYAERALLVTEAYRETEGAPPEIKRARAMEKILREGAVLIREDELIVGCKTPTALGSPLYPEFNCAWIKSEIETLSKRHETSFYVSEETRKILEEKVFPYWTGKTVCDRIVAKVPPESLKAVEEGLFFHYYLNRSIGHITVDYGKVIREGFSGLRRDIEKALDRLDPASPEKDGRVVFYKSLLRVVEAVLAFAHRHAREAERLSETCADPRRKEELAHLARICRRVPEYPAETFWEALQSFWFVHLVLNLESNGYAISPGRFDQYMNPLLQNDFQAGRLSRDQAQELLDCLWLKFAELTVAKEGGTAKASNTYTDFQNLNIGGLTADGGDGVNDVSYLCLSAQTDLRLPQPQLSCLVSTKTPWDFLLEACRLAGLGTGMPAFYNADELVLALMDKGKSLRDARLGGINGCVEITGQGNDHMASSGYVNLAKGLELALNDGASLMTGIQWGPRTGRPESLASMEDLWSAVAIQLEHMVALKQKYDNGARAAFAETCPVLCTSLVIDGCIEKGRDYHQGGARYHLPMMCGVGTGTVTDALAAIAHFVFNKGEVTLAELVEALRTNFEGREALRERLWNEAPKYGNDLDPVDEIASRLIRTFVRILKKFTDELGCPYAANMIPTTTHIPFGALTAATADGRLARQPLAEGISPVQGQDLSGPTAVVRTMGKIDHAATAGTLLNMKFSPQTLEGAGLPKFAALIRSYFDLGGHHMQFNVVSRATLLAAQERPEEHRSLLIRVAGYSDYFVMLSKEVQDEVISRMEHNR
ncbi:MAG: formate C-acetyltransferase/glycerol dehydratase family glycyl radical enzyme [Thermodesulfobacteriota bacterium]